MLEQISWKEFLIAIGSSCVAYYSILAVAGKIHFARQRENRSLPAYHGGDAMTAAQTPPPGPVSPPEKVSMANIAEETEQKGDPEFAALELLADEVEAIIAQFDTAHGSKEELLLALRKEIARYPTLIQPAFQRAISHLIIKVAGEQHQLTITEKEARECWPTA